MKKTTDADRINAKVDHIRELLLQKGEDYGDSYRAPGYLTPDIKPSDAIRVRISDKLKRLHNLITSGAGPANEPLIDSVHDLAGYAILWSIILDMEEEAAHARKI